MESKGTVELPPNGSPWLHNRSLEILFILLPPFLSVAAIFLFNNYFKEHTEVTTIWWMILVLGIDVTHVYSTLFRTYLDKESFEKNRNLLVFSPLFILVAGIVFYSVSAMLFWRILAYSAVFHFIRQQYGFMRLYSRNEQLTPLERHLDATLIYSVTLYPIIYWHLSSDIQFDWLIQGDFITYDMPVIRKLFGIIYLILCLVYLAYQVYKLVTSGKINIPKILVITGTGISWYTGIVYFNGDLVFTCLNVVTHGIPYMALIWIYGEKQLEEKKTAPPIALKIFKARNIGLFIFFLVLAAYFEEGLWDGLIWRDHKRLFSLFYELPQIDNHLILSILIPLLSLPQATHYFLDAFIWKVRKPETMPYLVNT